MQKYFIRNAKVAAARLEWAIYKILFDEIEMNIIKEKNYINDA
jgi:hypothetical protein